MPSIQELVEKYGLTPQQAQEFLLSQEGQTQGPFRFQNQPPTLGGLSSMLGITPGETQALPLGPPGVGPTPQEVGAPIQGQGITPPPRPGVKEERDPMSMRRPENLLGALGPIGIALGALIASRGGRKVSPNTLGFLGGLSGGLSNTFTERSRTAERQKAAREEKDRDTAHQSAQDLSFIQPGSPHYQEAQEALQKYKDLATNGKPIPPALAIQINQIAGTYQKEIQEGRGRQQAQQATQQAIMLAQARFAQEEKQKIEAKQLEMSTTAGTMVPYEMAKRQLYKEQAEKTQQESLKRGLDVRNLQAPEPPPGEQYATAQAERGRAEKRAERGLGLEGARLRESQEEHKLTRERQTRLDAERKGWKDFQEAMAKDRLALSRARLNLDTLQNPIVRGVLEEELTNIGDAKTGSPEWTQALTAAKKRLEGLTGGLGTAPTPVITPPPIPQEGETFTRGKYKFKRLPGGNVQRVE